MAQSASELKDKNQRGRKSTSNQMELTRVELMELDPMEVLEWEVERLEAGLNELEITIGASWTKSRKAYELNKALEMIKIDSQEKQAPLDSNTFMIQAFQQLQAQALAQAEALAAIAEKVSNNSENTGSSRTNKSRAKGRHPEKLERDVDYASFLQWEKTWNLYTISDNLDTLEEKQQTAILFSFFTKELLNDMEYRFKIDINGDQSVEEVLEQMKTYLKGQRSMVLARYNLFTRRQQMSETFEEWYIELRRLYDLAEAEDMTGEDLLTVLITTGIRDEKVRSKILEDLRTPTLDDTVKLIEQMTFAKDTNARIEKRREDSKIAAIGKRNSKTLYQKDKESRRMEKTPKMKKAKQRISVSALTAGRRGTHIAKLEDGK